jgi:hypothetical protein
MEPNAMANNMGGAMNDTANAFKRMRAQGAQPNTFGAPAAGAPRADGLDQAAINANPAGFAQWQQGAAAQAGSGQRGSTFGAAPNTNPVGSFGATNNLIGSQISPTNSAQTNTAQGYSNKAGADYNNFKLSAFQGVQPLAFGAERSALGAAGAKMDGLGYNFGAANAQYGQSQNAMQGLQALGGQNFGSGAASADTSKFNSELNTALEGLKGPNRGEIGAETMSLLEERSRPGYDQTLRSVGAKNAAMGRRGSGITTNELGDVTLARERELALARRDVSNDAAAQTLKDRLDVSNQQRGIAGDRFGAEVQNAQFADSGMARDQQGRQFGASLQRGIAGDIANNALQIGDRFGDQETSRVGLGERQAGFSRNVANDMGNYTRDEYSAGVDERNTRRKDEYDQGDFARTKFSDMRGYLGDERSNDRSNRNELRGERDYQYDLSQNAIDNDFRTAGFEESLRNNRYNRAQGTTSIGFGGTSPAGAYSDSANQYRQSSGDAFEGAGQSLAAAGNRRNGSGRGQTQLPAPTRTVSGDSRMA